MWIPRTLPLFDGTGDTNSRRHPAGCPAPSSPARAIRFIICLSVCLLMIIPRTSLAAGPNIDKVGSQGTNPLTDRTLDDLTRRQTTDPDFQPYSAGELVVRLFDSDSAAIDSVNVVYGTTVKRYFPLLNVFILDAGLTEDIQALADTMSLDPIVLYAHPNFIVEPMQPVQGSFPFSDYDYSGSYTGQDAATRLQLGSAHAHATGAGARVAVIDGGVDYNYDAFDGMVVGGYDYVDGDADPFDESGGRNSGHGTFVAGVIHLVAPDAEIVPYRVSDTSGASRGDVVAEAVMQAVADSCDVINISLVMYQEHNLLSGALAYARANGVVVVVAAGNEHTAVPAYPAVNPNVIAVAAVDEDDLLTDFSRYGQHIDLCAPGADVYSPYQTPWYAWWSGTSFAAPFVSGVAALVVERGNGLYEWAEIHALLTKLADDLDTVNPAYAGQMGAGMTNPTASLTQSATPDSAEVVPPLLSFNLVENANDTIYAVVSVVSDNNDATFTMSITDHRDFVVLTDTQGVVNDSVVFIVAPDTLPVGFYADTVLFDVQGVSNSPVFCAVQLTITGEQGSSDTASVTPSDHVFQVAQGSTDTIFACSYLISTNEPAPYFVEIVPGNNFVSLVDSAGMTNDTVCFTINPSTLGSGFHCDTLLYYVDGVDLPVMQTVCVTVEGAPDTTDAWLIPDTIFVTVPSGQTTPEIRCSFLGHWDDTSSYVTIPGDLTTPLQATGLTNDSVCVSIDPTLAGAATLYIDEVTYIVSQVDTAVLTIWLEIDKAPFVTPGEFFTVVPEGVPNPVNFCAFLYAETPGAFTGTVSDGSWLTLLTPSGTAPDTVCARIDPDGLPIGAYSDTIFFTVENTVVVAPWVVNLLVVADTIVTPQDSAWALPSSFEFEVNENTEIAISDCFAIHSTNAPATWFGYVLDGGSFVEIVDSAGITNDTACFTIQHGGLSAGYYRDTILVYVEGFVNAIPVYVGLTVHPEGGPATASLNPVTLEFYAPLGPADTVFGSAYLSSSNAPADFVAYVPFDSMVFVNVLTPIGVTNDSVRVAVSANGLPEGTYVNNVAFMVDGVPDPVWLEVILNVVPIGAKLGQNFPNPFNPDTRIAFSLAAASHVRLDVFNVLGQRVAVLVDESLSAGNHEVTWDGRDDHGYQVASGVYFYRLETPNASETRKMILLK